MAAAAAGPAASQRFFQNFPDALIDQDPQAALEELTKALEQKPDDAQYYCQRAYCHILLGNDCGSFSYKVYCPFLISYLYILPMTN
ncbi:protein SGT1 homolog [Gorilla gorilla gorilla]|uniref:protein SGT1 homolog n=1 Tax=Gorilla gorilla gorilla TaxID=9595 RepID=UPI0008F53BAD|nr:protein SGT1 homolog [Gorilla gorilla gorilla]